MATYASFDDIIDDYLYNAEADSRDLPESAFHFRATNDAALTIDPSLLHDDTISSGVDATSDFLQFSSSAPKAGFTDFDSFGAQPIEPPCSLELLPVEAHQQISALSTQTVTDTKLSTGFHNQHGLRSLEYPALPNLFSFPPNQSSLLQSERLNDESTFLTFDLTGPQLGGRQSCVEPSPAECYQPSPSSCGNDGLCAGSTLELQAQHGLQSMGHSFLWNAPKSADPGEISLQTNVDPLAASDPGVQDSDVLLPRSEHLASNGFSDHLNNSSLWDGGLLAEQNSSIVGVKDSGSQTQCAISGSDKYKQGQPRLEKMRHKTCQMMANYKVSRMSIAMPPEELDVFKFEPYRESVLANDLQASAQIAAHADRCRGKKRKQSPDTLRLSGPPVPVSFHPSQPTLTDKNSKRRSTFSDQRREEVSKVRALGACMRCKYLGIRVSHCIDDRNYKCLC